MTAKPILFSSPMVRALLAGTKTQTRRVLKPQPFIDAMGNFCAPDRNGKVWNYGQNAKGVPHIHKFADTELRVKAGDRLYVRESWNWTFIKDLAPGETLGRTLDDCCEANGGLACPIGDGIVYAATNAQEHPEFGKARWKPSIHMPRYASRLTLTVSDVRVERLQDITEVDAWAEGIDAIMKRGIPTRHDVTLDLPGSPRWFQPRGRDVYQSLWEAINGAGSWDRNPWVVAYSFSVEHGNIDQLATIEAEK